MFTPSYVYSHVQQFITSTPAYITVSAPSEVACGKIICRFSIYGDIIRPNDLEHYLLLVLNHSYHMYPAWTRPKNFKSGIITIACWFLQKHCTYKFHLHASPWKRRHEGRVVYYMVFHEVFILMDSCAFSRQWVCIWTLQRNMIRTPCPEHDISTARSECILWFRQGWYWLGHYLRMELGMNEGLSNYYQLEKNRRIMAME